MLLMNVVVSCDVVISVIKYVARNKSSEWQTTLLDFTECDTRDTTEDAPFYDVCDDSGNFFAKYEYERFPQSFCEIFPN